MSRPSVPPASPDADLIAAIELILRPLARLFLEHGVVFPTVEDLLKAALVRVASEEFGLPNQSPTDSRISVLSGVHRKDVRRLRETAFQPASLPITLPFASEVVTRWINDPLYHDARGKPRVLPRSAPPPQPSFDGLVESISTDVRPRVLLDELIRLGVAAHTVDGDVELLVYAFVPQKDRKERLFYFGRNMHDHLAACVHNLGGREPPMLEQSIFSFELSDASVTRIADLTRREWQKVMARLVNAIAACEERDRLDRRTTRRMNIGLYFFHESADSPATHGPPRSRGRGAPASTPPRPRKTGARRT
ncbi:MAG TPA: DUF6502 family protein [Casimicrobiaceae bacterium]|nr:DUF6502 family protein [Casimicrobiaceae bacterium]